MSFPGIEKEQHCLEPERHEECGLKSNCSPNASMLNVATEISLLDSSSPQPVVSRE